MATSQSVPAAAPVSPCAMTGGLPPVLGGPTVEPRTVAAAPVGVESRALVSAAQPPAMEPDPLNGRVTRLPVEVDVAVPIQEFRVRDLLALEPGRVIPSRWNYGEDVPLAAGDVQLAWSEFEVIDGQLGVRITRLP